MEMPIRKNIRLRGYDYSQNGCYFITVCVRDKHEILGKIFVGDDAHIVPKKIKLTEHGIVAEKFIKNINHIYNDVCIDKYVIMPNHVHMILIIKNKNRPENNGPMRASAPTNAIIPRVIRSFKILTSKECGLSLWQRAYYDHIIRNDSEYQKIWQYIDENPEKWQEDCYFK